MKTTDEETIYEQKNGLEKEETVVENTDKNEETPQEPKQKSNKRWAEAAIGAGTGVAAGIIGTLFTSGTIAPAEDTEDNGNGENGVSDDGLTTPVVTDGELAIAHNVNDDMSFGEAFRVAHDEVGPGGVFEWHGQLYGTYTAAEWNSLSSEERMEYNSHLRVVGTPDYASNVSHHEQVQEQNQEQVQVQETETGDVATNETATHEVGQEEVEVASANTETDSNLASETPSDTSTPTSEVEVEVLGVEYVHTDDGQEVAVGGMMVNGQEVYVLDADNDGIGDVAVMDVNGDGQVDENEIMDLSETPIDMSEFPTDDASMCSIATDEPDYLADGTI